MSADSIILTIFQELITHGYNEVCNRDALKMWGIPKLLYSTMAGDSEHTHQGQYVSATRAGTRTILCTSLASGSSTVPNTKYRHRIKSRCQTPLWPSAASRDRCPTLLCSTQESLDTLLADTSWAPEGLSSPGGSQDEQSRCRYSIPWVSFQSLVSPRFDPPLHRGNMWQSEAVWAVRGQRQKPRKEQA